MVFSSHIFVFYFLPLVLAGYYLLVAAKAGATVRHSFLTVAGMVFYGWWNPWFVLLMLGTTVLDYNLGRMIVNARGNERRRKLAVTLSVASNLSALAFFKYTAFGIETVRTIATALQWGEVSVPEFFQNIILPAGISFYVFQSLSYCIDLYRGHARPAESFIDFTCFVSLFPHLVAGPIVRYGLIADQMRHRVHTVEGFGYGIARFCTGFAKKILLANPMGPIADACFGAHPDVLSFSTAWLGLIAYAFQIYFDFSAYSDMAVGLARMLGFRFCENFDSPYKSSSITEFWRRWHMSLSTFLRDYLYIPLGGNRKGPGQNLRESHDCDVVRRAVARSVMEFHHLGRHARWDARARTLARPAGAGKMASALPLRAAHVPHYSLRLGLLPRGQFRGRRKLLPGARGPARQRRSRLAPARRNVCAV